MQRHLQSLFKSKEQNVFIFKNYHFLSLEGGTVRAGGRGDGILRWDLGDLDRRVLVVLLTDAARDTPSLIFGYSYIWPGPLFVCPGPSSCLGATWGTPDTCADKRTSGPEIRLSSQGEWDLNVAKHQVPQPLLNKLKVLGSSRPLSLHSWRPFVLCAFPPLKSCDPCR